MSKAIVILNFNGAKHLRTYLPSVIAHRSDWEIIVADNASSDNSISILQNEFKEVKVLALATNHGFAEGYNQALKQIQGQYKYYFILNSDVRLSANWDQPLLHFLEQNPHVVAVGPKVLSDLQPSHFEHAGAAGGYLDALYFPFCRGRLLDSIEQDKGQYNSPQEVSWVSGAAMLVRADDFHQAGGFDGHFFAHMEEIDLCLRWAALGKKMYCIPNSEVFHLGGGTLSYENPRKVFLNFRNSLWMLVKNQQRFLLPVLFIRMCLDGLAALQFLAKGKPLLTWQVFLAHMALYRHFSTFYKKRTAALHRPYKYHGLLIWDYFGKGIRNFSALNKRKFHA